MSTIAVLVIGLGWWFWPVQVDPRFVGRWSNMKTNNPLEWIFLENGYAEGRSERFPVQRWTVRNNRLKVSPVLHWRNADGILWNVRRLTWPESNTYNIVSVGETKFDLELDRNIYHFQRIRGDAP